MTHEQPTPDPERASQAQVVNLARQLAAAINAGPLAVREQWCEDAVSLVRSAVEIPDLPTEPAPDRGAGNGTFNPFGIGIPLVLMGGVLIFLFPPVGLLFFALAGIMVAWGVGATLLARS